MPQLPLLDCRSCVFFPFLSFPFLSFPFLSFPFLSFLFDSRQLFHLRPLWKTIKWQLKNGNNVKQTVQWSDINVPLWLLSHLPILRFYPNPVQLQHFLGNPKKKVGLSTISITCCFWKAFFCLLWIPSKLKSGFISASSPLFHVLPRQASFQLVKIKK